MKLDRLIYIITVLLNREQITAVELAKHFEVSVRTIYRDIEALTMAGIPIYSSQGSGGGFSIMGTYKLDKQLLKAEEASSIITALKGMTSTIDDISLNTIIEKMKPLTKSAEEKASREVILDFSPWGTSAKQKERISLLRKAIENLKVVSFVYTDSSGVITDRELEPASLIFKGYSWYVHGYCREREAFRLFRLTRVSHIRILDETFDKRDIPSIEIMGIGSRESNLTFTLKFKPAIRARVQDYFEEDQIEYLKDGHMLVTVAYPEDEWVYGFILGFGAEVEVMEPQHLRDIIKEKSRKIYKIYK